MCCFTDSVEQVSDTNIYARAQGPRQILVYEMQYATERELAMVLPLPVPPGSAEDALEFVNLEDCPDFFAHLRAGFPRERHTGSLGMETLGATADLGVEKLEVVEVGGFEASFVPSPADFGRLDERFRLPADLWLQLNTYRDWGFAVFKLKPATRAKRVHPMAFRFPRRDAGRLFFPTLHIHHRAVERIAGFDHTLYCQIEPQMNWHVEGWQESWAAARRFIDCEAAKPLFDLEFPCWKRELSGHLENMDTWLGRGGRVPAPVRA